MSIQSNFKQTVKAIEQSNNYNDQRQQFNNYLEYLTSTLGFAVGYGSIWRFPYLIFKNGGGIFLIPYFLLLILIGIPIFYLETVIGQMYKEGSAKIFESIHIKFKGLGIYPILCSLVGCTYYNFILALSYYYFFQSFIYPLPWTVDRNKKSEEVIWNLNYFYKDVLNLSDSILNLGDVVWPIAFCYCLSQLICYLCIFKGVSFSGKVAIFTAISPFFLLMILMFLGINLEGANLGLTFLFKPDYSKLFEIKVWVDAATQVIFQMSIGCAVLIFYGSYRDSKEEIVKTSVFVPILTCIFGMVGAIAVFTVMGYISNIFKINIINIPLQGPELSFVVYPSALTLLPFQNLWAILFFLMMILLGIDSQFGQLDTVCGWIEDEFRQKGSQQIIIYEWVDFIT